MSLPFSLFKNHAHEVSSRVARHADLIDFININEQYSYIEGDAAQRVKLYENWFKVCPSAFRITEHIMSDRAPKLVAVSIILPLSTHGKDILLRDNTSALLLRNNDIEQRNNHNYNCLLFDTLVIDRRFRQKRFAFTQQLLADHLYALLGPTTHHSVEFYTEPDLKSVKDLVISLHFKRVIKQGAELYARTVQPGLRVSHFMEIAEQLKKKIC